MKIKILILLSGILVILSWMMGNRNWEKVAGTSDQMEKLAFPFDSISNHLLVEACLDCHGNHTNIPFYGRFFPISSFITGHVKHGRSEFNLAKWDKIGYTSRYNACQKMIQEIDKGNMPLSSYALLHPEARITDSEREQLLNSLRNYQENLQGELLHEQFSGNSLLIRTASGDTTLIFRKYGERRKPRLFTSPLLNKVQEPGRYTSSYRLYFSESAHDEKVAITSPAKAIYHEYMTDQPTGIIYCLHSGAGHHLIFKDLRTFQDHRLFSSTDSIQNYEFL